MWKIVELDSKTLSLCAVGNISPADLTAFACTKCVDSCEAPMFAQCQMLADDSDIVVKLRYGNASSQWVAKTVAAFDGLSTPVLLEAMS